MPTMNIGWNFVRPAWRSPSNSGWLEHLAQLVKPLAEGSAIVRHLLAPLEISQPIVLEGPVEIPLVGENLAEGKVELNARHGFGLRCKQRRHCRDVGRLVRPLQWGEAIVAGDRCRIAGDDGAEEVNGTFAPTEPIEQVCGLQQLDRTARR